MVNEHEQQQEKKHYSLGSLIIQIVKAFTKYNQYIIWRHYFRCFYTNPTKDNWKWSAVAYEHDFH